MAWVSSADTGVWRVDLVMNGWREGACMHMRMQDDMTCICVSASGLDLAGLGWGLCCFGGISREQGQKRAAER